MSSTKSGNDPVFIIAAEASSALYGQRLLEIWKKRGRSVDAFGIGNTAMENLGFRRLGRSEEMAVVGLSEVIKHLPLIRQVYRALLSEVERTRPKFALLLDYPEFNLMLARDLKKRGVKVVYYISPQIWAWRRSRIHKIRRRVDQMLVIFPFEVDFYRSYGVPAEFVGHPLLDELPESRFLPPEEDEDRRIRRARFGFAPDDIVLGLMPGSRESEIRHHLEIQLQTASLLAHRNPKVRTAVLVAPTLQRERFASAIDQSSSPVQLIQLDPVDMIGLTDVILCASGTATLLVALLRKPMVIMYRMNSLSASAAKLLVRHIRYFGMPNLILGTRIVPEIFQEDANPERLCLELAPYLDRNSRWTKSLELGEIESKLGAGGASERVADCLERFFESSSGGK